jgi:hypothetical protein
MTYKQFETRMKEFKSIKDELDALYNFASKLKKITIENRDNQGSDYLISLFLNLMSDAMGLDDAYADDNWIWWWVYDTNWGKTGNIVKIDGKKFKVDSLKKLYNLITTNLK